MRLDYYSENRISGSAGPPKPKCHEYFRCRKASCVMFGEGEHRNCWEVENALTFCIGVGEDSIKESERIYFCRNCLYYQHMQDDRAE